MRATVPEPPKSDSQQKCGSVRIPAQNQKKTEADLKGVSRSMVLIRENIGIFARGPSVGDSTACEKRCRDAQSPST